MPITINKRIRFEGGTAPFTYTIFSETPGCLNSITPRSGTTEINQSFVDVELVYNTTECISTGQVKIFIQDSEGCFNTLDINVENPCDNIQIESISSTSNGDEITFTGVVSNATGGLTYDWRYNTSLFEFVRQLNNFQSIVLRAKTPRPNIEVTDIELTVSDGNGCSDNDTFTWTFCQSVARNYPATICINGSAALVVSNPILLEVFGCSRSATFDFNSIVINPIGNNNPVTYSLNGNEVTFSVPNNANTSGTHVFQWYMFDNYGTQTTTGVITVVVDKCNESDPCLVINDYTTRLDCLTTADIPITLDLLTITNQFININGSNNCNPDYRSFKFVPVIGQTYNNQSGQNAILTTNYGTVTFNAQNVIQYNLTSLPSGTGTIQWEIFNNAGASSGIIALTVIYDCLQPPIVVDDDICVTCNDANIEIDVLANDSNFVASTLAITQQPTNGVATILNGKIRYTPNPNFEGTDTLLYTVQNSNGIVSTEATVTITVLCSGTGGIVALCN